MSLILDKTGHFVRPQHDRQAGLQINPHDFFLYSPLPVPSPRHPGSKLGRPSHPHPLHNSNFISNCTGARHFSPEVHRNPTAFISAWHLWSCIVTFIIHNSFIMRMVILMMMVFGRTGRIIPLSTPRLPMIATASPPQNHPPRHIHRQPRHLLSKRHRLAQIRKIIRKIRPSLRHNPLLNKAADFADDADF